MNIQSKASKVLSALEELALVRRDDDSAFWVIDAGDLLDAWAEASDYRRYEIVPVHMTGEELGSRGISPGASRRRT